MNTAKPNSNNTVVGYIDDMTIVVHENGDIYYAPVSEGLYPIGTVVNDDELFSIKRLPYMVQKEILKLVEA